MSLNDLSLNPHLLTQLYTNSLLETEANPSNTAAQKMAPIIAAGELHGPLKNITAPVDATPKAETQPQKVPEIHQPQQAVAVNEQPVAYGNTPSLGGNKKGVLILVKNDAAPFLPDEELEFLSAVLSACQLSIADVAIINLHHYPQTYIALLQQFSAKQVLLLGVAPQEVDLPFHFPHFQLQPFDGRTYLLAYPLGQMVQDRSLKMQLWGCLKQLYGV